MGFGWLPGAQAPVWTSPREWLACTRVEQVVRGIGLGAQCFGTGVARPRGRPFRQSYLWVWSTHANQWHPPAHRRRHALPSAGHHRLSAGNARVATTARRCSFLCCCLPATSGFRMWVHIASVSGQLLLTRSRGCRHHVRQKMPHCSRRALQFLFAMPLLAKDMRHQRPEKRYPAQSPG